MGAQSHNGLTMTCTSIGDDYYVVRAAADAAYCSIIGRIDWNRILLEASARHGALTDAGCHPQIRGYNAGHDEMCPECVRQALLAEDRLIGWITQGQPTPAEPPADVPGGDWARVLADGVRHRNASVRQHARRVGDPHQPVRAAVEYVLQRHAGTDPADLAWKAVAAALDAAGVPALAHPWPSRT